MAKIENKEEIYQTVYHKISGRWLRQTLAGLFNADFMRFRYIKAIVPLHHEKEETYLLEIGADLMAMERHENEEKPPEGGLTWGDFKRQVEEAGVADETPLAGVQVLYGQSEQSNVVEVNRLDDNWGVVIVQKFD